MNGKMPFFQVVRQYEKANLLTQAALDERLGDWTGVPVPGLND
jgi:hypothetical protein